MLNKQDAKAALCEMGNKLKWLGKLVGKFLFHLTLAATAIVCAMFVLWLFSVAFWVCVWFIVAALVVVWFYVEYLYAKERREWDESCQVNNVGNHQDDVRRST
jgi:Ca2+/Na+ antiporter